MATQTHCGERDRRSITSSSLTLPALSALSTAYNSWTLAFFASLTLVDTENVARRVDNRSVSPPPDRPSPARCVRVRSDVDARHQLENASVPWRGHDSSAIVKMPGPERLLQTTFLSLRRTAAEQQQNPTGS